MKGPLDVDRINNATRQSVGGAALRALTGFQNDYRHTQVLGSAVLFLLVCRAYKVRASEMLAVADNILAQMEREGELRAVQLYVENELVEKAKR